ncbi:hypothetical protein B0T10DRAFT_603637 [Thelonectria olida]|uniref:Pre-mRNA-splicing factor 38B n=1 Tax=Thelonectria olida TaxID=1576542 RepID=A0A9P8WA78_9HYPO|nr:hypothetical protein B0T10DRAFT_603637 [Thelonectria olida]
MGNDQLLTDEYVAGRLTEEANDCSLKYSALGMEGYRQTKKPANMLKPNTRFLRHIIKGTDSHNKALLAKEASESQARLKNLERAEEAKRLKTNPTQQDVRRRQMGDIHAILGGKKRRRTDDSEAASSSQDLIDSKSRETPGSRKSRNDKGQGERQDKSKDLTRDRHHERAHRRRLSYSDDRPSRTDEKSDRGNRSTPDNKRRRSRSRNFRSEEEERRRRHRRRRDRSRSTEHRRRSRSRSRSPRRHKSRHRERSPIEEKEAKAKQDEQKRQDDDSDSLEDLIGPAPVPTHRGRGKVGGYSGIDRRFSETYDPKTDIQMDEDDENGNTDDAFELFRDRQKLKQNQQAQEQRMRAAGFSEDQIKRANGVDTVPEDNVRWSKAGEKRAWDQGKSVDSEGSVSVDEVV